MNSCTDEDYRFVISKLYNFGVTQPKHRIIFDDFVAIFTFMGWDDHKVKHSAFIAFTKFILFEEDFGVFFIGFFQL